MKYGELTLGQIEALVNKLGGMNGMHAFLRGEMTILAFTSLPIIVDYNLSLADMIKEGEYDRMDPWITPERFPLERAGVVRRTVQLCHYGYVMTTQKVLKMMDVSQREPATIADLLAYAAQYPEQHHSYPIVGLGSIAHGNVPYLSMYGGKRSLMLCPSSNVWQDDCRFLARTAPAA